MSQPDEHPPGRAELEQRVRKAMRDLADRRGDVQLAQGRRDDAIADLRLAGATIQELVEFTGLSAGLISAIGAGRGITTRRTVTRTVT